jgi:hypothetical protein
MILLGAAEAESISLAMPSMKHELNKAWAGVYSGDDM